MGHHVSAPPVGRLRPPFSLPSGPRAVEPVRAGRDLSAPTSRAPQFQAVFGTGMPATSPRRERPHAGRSRTWRNSTGTLFSRILDNGAIPITGATLHGHGLSPPLVSRV